MKLLHKLFPLGHFLISLLFIGCGLALITFAALQLWQGIKPWGGLALDQRLHTVLDSIAVLTVAVAALELGQTILGRGSATGGPDERADTRAPVFIAVHDCPRRVTVN